MPTGSWIVLCWVLLAAEGQRPGDYWNANCKAQTEPHYRTFDNYGFDYQADFCELVFAQNSTPTSRPFSVYTIATWPEGFDDSQGALPYAMRIVIPKYEVTMARDEPVMVNNQEVTLTTSAVCFPDGSNEGDADFCLFRQHPYSIFYINEYIQVWHTDYIQYVHVTSALRNKVIGLCGDYDGSMFNDEEIAEQYMGGEDFRSCADEAAKIQNAQYCSSPEDQQKAEDKCRFIVDELPCDNSVVYVNLEQTYSTCVVDFCTDDRDNSHCEGIRNTMLECNVSPELRLRYSDIAGCRLVCPENMVYEPCTPACPATCPNAKGDEECEPPDDCWEGCVCAEGLVLDGESCIRPEDCGCLYKGDTYYQVGQMRFDKECTYLHTCLGSNNWNAEPYTCDEERATCVRDILNAGDKACICKEGYEFIEESQQCEDLDECEKGNNVNCDPVKAQCKNAIGTYDCICRESYERDEQTGLCVCAEGFHDTEDGSCVPNEDVAEVTEEHTDYPVEPDDVITGPQPTDQPVTPPVEYPGSTRGPTGTYPPTHPPTAEPLPVETPAEDYVTSPVEYPGSTMGPTGTYPPTHPPTAEPLPVETPEKDYDYIKSTPYEEPNPAPNPQPTHPQTAEPQPVETPEEDYDYVKSTPYEEPNPAPNNDGDDNNSENPGEGGTESPAEPEVVDDPSGGVDEATDYPSKDYVPIATDNSSALDGNDRVGEEEDNRITAETGSTMKPNQTFDFLMTVLLIQYACQ